MKFSSMPGSWHLRPACSCTVPPEQAGTSRLSWEGGKRKAPSAPFLLPVVLQLVQTETGEGLIPDPFAKCAEKYQENDLNLIGPLSIDPIGFTMDQMPYVSISHHPDTKPWVGIAGTSQVKKAEAREKSEKEHIYKGRTQTNMHKAVRITAKITISESRIGAMRANMPKYARQISPFQL